MSDSGGFGGPLGPGSGYPEPQRRFDPTQPITANRYATPPQPGPPRPEPPRRRGSRLPLLLTVAVIALVVVVVGGATLYAHHRDTLTASPTSPGSPASSGSAGGSTSPAGGAPTAPGENATSTSFDTDDGSGTLTIVSHQWSESGNPAPSQGAYLELELRVTATSGSLILDTTQFQAFDAKGDLYQSSTETTHQPALIEIDLSEGQSVEGSLSFDIPRGDVTVLLGNSLGEPVAALKVKG